MTESDFPTGMKTELTAFLLAHEEQIVSNALSLRKTFRYWIGREPFPWDFGPAAKAIANTIDEEVLAMVIAEAQKS
jgi:hypothetical protein